MQPSDTDSRVCRRCNTRKDRRRSAIIGSSNGPIDRDALWTGDCALCDDGIDRELAYPDPMSKSLDHIIPISRGGGHVQENLQYTHLVCNLRKRNSMPESA